MTIIQRIALTVGGSLMAGSFLAGALVPQTQEQEIRTVDFGRSGPCTACGHATPITITAPDGQSWYITGPGSVEEMGLKYCPANQSCKVTYHR